MSLVFSKRRRCGRVHLWRGSMAKLGLSQNEGHSALSQWIHVVVGGFGKRHEAAAFCGGESGRGEGKLEGGPWRLGIWEFGKPQVAAMQPQVLGQLHYS